MRTLLVLLISSIFLQANWKDERENLDKLYTLGEFRIFYTLQGENALPKENQIDLNNNNIPDYIENITQRLKVTHDVFTKLLGFKDPLKSKRYQETKFVDIHVLKSENSSAGDAIVTFDYKYFKSNEKVVSMKIRNDLDKDTMTPSHEYFHLLQNSYTMFKNRWYTEGTARWSEKVFEKGTGERDNKLPSAIKELEELFTKTYDTKGFWRKLAYECDTNNGIFKNTLNLKTNVPNYPNLIEDNRINGYEFMRVFLENLDIQDNIASKKRGLNEFDWDEKEQIKNEENNVYILIALKNTLKKICNKNEEITQFTNLIDLYVKGKK